MGSQEAADAAAGLTSQGGPVQAISSFRFAESGKGIVSMQNETNNETHFKFQNAFQNF